VLSLLIPSAVKRYRQSCQPWFRERNIRNGRAESKNLAQQTDTAKIDPRVRGSRTWNSRLGQPPAGGEKAKDLLRGATIPSLIGLEMG
jgi:hypothetical protein